MLDIYCVVFNSVWVNGNYLELVLVVLVVFYCSEEDVLGIFDKLDFFMVDVSFDVFVDMIFLL